MIQTVTCSECNSRVSIKGAERIGNGEFVCMACIHGAPQEEKGAESYSGMESCDCIPDDGGYNMSFDTAERYYERARERAKGC